MKRFNFLEKIVFLFILISAISTLLIYFYFSTQRYFMGDDFPLLVSARSLKSIFLPIGDHFRPIVRIHFLLSRIFGFYPIPFNILSLFLHIFASFFLYLVLKEEWDKKFALFASLVFFSLFSPNESIHWISSVGVIYCLLFALLSIYFFKKEKMLLSIFFMILSSFSYEVWCVLPFYFLLSKKRNLFIIITSLILILVHVSIFVLLRFSPGSYGGMPYLNQLPLRISYYLFKTLFPFTPFLENSVFPLIFILSIPFLIYLFLKNRDKALLPIVFYFIPATIFLASYHIASRFFYFPALSIGVFITALFFLKKPYKYIGFLTILYLSTLSPLLNYFDGIDYLQYSLKFKSIINEGEKILSGLENGDRITVINRFSTSLTEETARTIRGRAKLFLHRGKGIGGLIDLDVFVNFLLKKKGMKSVPLSKEEGVKIIVIGKGDFVSKYSFEVRKIKN